VLLAPSVWGEQKSIDYIKKLSGQAQGLLGCDTEDRIASGEFAALALDCAGTGPNKRPEYQGVLAVQVVSDNAQRRPYYALVPKNARNPEAAKLYTVYLATEAGQKMLRQFWGFDLAEHPGSFRQQQVAALQAQGVKFRDITISWWAQQAGIAEALRRMIKEFTSARN
jgi:ABC-type Fe3+ transport system substrate-binding protein